MKLQFLCIFLFCSFFLNAQGLNRNSLVEQLNVKEDALFLINGIAFTQTDSLNLANQLSKLNSRTIVDITAIKHKGQIGMGYKDIVLIQYAVNLNRKLVKNRLKAAKRLFQESDSLQDISEVSENSQVYINGLKIDSTEARRKICKLKVKKTAYVFLNKKDISFEGGQKETTQIIIWEKHELIKADNEWKFYLYVVHGFIGSFYCL